MGGAKQFCLSDDVETTKLADKLLVVIFWSVIPQSEFFLNGPNPAFLVYFCTFSQRSDKYWTIWL